MKYFTLVLIMMLLSGGSVFSQLHTNERAEWFTDARFGMFIHWGIYSGAEGYWKGEKLRFHNDYAEWIKYRNRISNDEYITLLNRFLWDEIDPEEWVILAKEAGMKYLTVTAKHHDGFGLWDSRVSHYDLGDYTDPKRDVIRELSGACRKHGIRFGLYYSHWVDWEHEYGWDHTREVYGIEEEEYDRYWQEKVIPQVRELLTNYGEISMLWFDMWKHHSETVVTQDQLMQLKSLIRELQPGCLVNSRLGLSMEEDADIDFKTLGDNQLGSQKEDFPWQSPATVAHSWGFHATDDEWKSTTRLLKSLINNVSLNGNYMLNIGPRANGEVPHEISHRLREMGKWLNINGEAIYGAEAFDLRKDQHDWGKITCKETGQGCKLFFHVFNWPLNKTLTITGISSGPDKIYLLADKQKQSLEFEQSGPVMRVKLPGLQPDPYLSVVVAEYPQKPETIEGLVAQTTGGGYSLLPVNGYPVNSGSPVKANRRESVPEHLRLSSVTQLQWKIYVDEPGKRTVDVSYSYQGNSGGGSLSVDCANQTLEHWVVATGKTVGEPKADWVIDNYRSHRLGEVIFPAPGTYEIVLEMEPGNDDPVNFQWIWIQ